MTEDEIVEIYRDTVRPLYVTVTGWTGGDDSRTEDLLQETYLRAVRAWHESGPPDRPLAWLRTVARNLLVSEARRRSPIPDSELAESVRCDPDPLDERIAIGEGLAALRGDQAEMLAAFHVEGRSVRDLARQKGVSERAIEGRLRRARLALRRILGRRTREREKRS